ncbi:hypothetical protein NL676_021216 [Syzygium grande]|nr:hypothetical protein NL676_021216 [Syzygium grande]
MECAPPLLSTMIRGLPRATDQGRRPLHEQVLGGHGAPTTTRQRLPRHRGHQAWARATLSRSRLWLLQPPPSEGPLLLRVAALPDGLTRAPRPRRR